MRTPVPPPVPSVHRNTPSKEYTEAYTRMERFIKGQPYLLRNGWVTGICLSIMPLLLAIAFATEHALLIGGVICIVITLRQTSKYKSVVKKDCEKSEALKMYHTIARKLNYDPKSSFFNILWFKIKNIDRQIETIYLSKPLDEVIDDYEEFFDPNYVRKVKPEEVKIDGPDTGEKCIHEVNADEKSWYKNDQPTVDDTSTVGMKLGEAKKLLSKWGYQITSFDSPASKELKRIKDISNEITNDINEIKSDLQDMAHKINGQRKYYNQSEFDNEFQKLEEQIIREVDRIIDGKYLTAKHREARLNRNNTWSKSTFSGRWSNIDSLE